MRLGGMGDPLYCVWCSEADGEEAGRALAIRRPPRGSRMGRVASKVIFDSSPATKAQGSDFVSPLVAWVKDQPALLEVKLGSLDARSEWTPGAIPYRQRRREYVLPPDGRGFARLNMRGPAGSQ